jgi:hypothetical protein
VAASDIAVQIAETGRAPGLSAEHLLHRLTTLAARMLPGCYGASISVWESGRIIRTSVSHVDLTALRSLPRRATEDPERHVASSGMAVDIPDTLASGTWQAFCTAAAAFGLRSAAFRAMGAGTRGAFGFYSAEPWVLDAASLATVAGLAGVVLRGAEDRDQLASTAHNLQASLGSRSVIDQAIGIMMAERSCTAGAAFADLQRASQRSNLKLADVARNLVARRSPN